MSAHQHWRHVNNWPDSLNCRAKRGSCLFITPLLDHFASVWVSAAPRDRNTSAPAVNSLRRYPLVCSAARPALPWSQSRLLLFARSCTHYKYTRRPVWSQTEARLGDFERRKTFPGKAVAVGKPRRKRRLLPCSQKLALKSSTRASQKSTHI